jgi:hypothetical protein
MQDYAMEKEFQNQEECALKQQFALLWDYPIVMNHHAFLLLFAL